MCYLKLWGTNQKSEWFSRKGVGERHGGVWGERWIRKDGEMYLWERGLGGRSGRGILNTAKRSDESNVRDTQTYAYMHVYACPWIDLLYVYHQMQELSHAYTYIHMHILTLSDLHVCARKCTHPRRDTRARGTHKWCIQFGAFTHTYVYAQTRALCMLAHEHRFPLLKT